MRARHGLAILGLALIGGAGLVALPTAAFATAGTATITGGSLTFTAPNTVAFAATLTGVDQTVNSNQSFDVKDLTGSGTGWNITATSTTFTSGANTLATTAVTEQATPTNACDAGTACTLAATNVTYPYTLPAAGVAPTATKLYNATASTGMGNQTSVDIMTLAVPAATLAGSYTSTWTYSLVSAP